MFLEQVYSIKRLVSKHYWIKDKIIHLEVTFEDEYYEALYLDCVYTQSLDYKNLNRNGHGDSHL